jgi:hypothetical protein
MISAPETTPATGLEALPLGDVHGWAAFGDVEFIAQMALVLLISVALSWVIAYHPSTRRKATTVEEFERPKSFILYSIVGAVVALIVRVQPSMALVVFGMGGLLRFRSKVGESKDTGRVILVTVTGLCCGLQLYVVAVLTTLVGWVVVYALEARTVARLVIQGLPRESIAAAATAHARILRDAGCKILGEEKSVEKGIVSLVYATGDLLDHEGLEAKFAGLAPELRGALDWDATKTKRVLPL